MLHLCTLFIFVYRKIVYIHNARPKMIFYRYKESIELLAVLRDVARLLPDGPDILALYHVICIEIALAGGKILVNNCCRFQICGNV